MQEYIAFEVSQNEHAFERGLVVYERSLPKIDEIEIHGSYSSVNYKDALAATKNGGVIRKYPIVTGFGFGVTAPGGYSQYQHVAKDWIVSLPDSLTEKEAMSFGTAGFTAALAVKELQKQIADKNQNIVVTGASGGVGSVAIALLTKLGYKNIQAISRKKEASTWLKELGATDVSTPEEWIPKKLRPLASQTTHAIIDTVGGTLLESLLPQLHYGGSAFLCGNAAGISLQTTVLPFILRGIRVIGIDSVLVELNERQNIWEFLGEHRDILEKLPTREILLSDLDETFDALLAGTHEGRTIVQLGVKP